MIPEFDPALLDEPLEGGQQPSLTWKLDFDKGRMVGKADGLEAIKQAIFKVFQTDRFRHDIYSPDYGHELALLLGSSPVIVQSEAARMIEEALLPDDRIDAVENVEAVVDGDRLSIRFTVATMYGSLEQEVSRGV
ncbi:DUF2634 domain-containing protein [Cohnella hongkongensis]|uniref:DUF2634 domain-containing protein n=1 Tax=Cohnella hongkongensis TaxID=178337 RepID=A0ABV9FNR0_9BACL